MRIKAKESVDQIKYSVPLLNATQYT